MQVLVIDGPLQAFHDGTHKLVGISHEVTFHHVAIPDVTFGEIHPNLLDDDKYIGVDTVLAAVLVVEVGNLAGDDDQAALIQDGQLLIGLNLWVGFFDDRAFGNEAIPFPVEFFQGGVDLGQDLLFFLDRDLMVLVKITRGELFGRDRGLFGPDRGDPGDEAWNQERQGKYDYQGHGSGNLTG